MSDNLFNRAKTWLKAVFTPAAYTNERFDAYEAYIDFLRDQQRRLREDFKSYMRANAQYTKSLESVKQTAVKALREWDRFETYKSYTILNNQKRCAFGFFNTPVARMSDTRETVAEMCMEQRHVDTQRWTLDIEMALYNRGIESDIAIELMKLSAAVRMFDEILHDENNILTFISNATIEEASDE